jgi:hypothetical protein
MIRGHSIKACFPLLREALEVLNRSGDRNPETTGITKALRIQMTD